MKMSRRSWRASDGSSAVGASADEHPIRQTASAEQASQCIDVGIQLFGGLCAGKHVAIRPHDDGRYLMMVQPIRE